MRKQVILVIAVAFTLAVAFALFLQKARQHPANPEVDQAAIDREARKSAKAAEKQRKQAAKKRRKSDWPIENQPPPARLKAPMPSRVGGGAWS